MAIVLHPTELDVDDDGTPDSEKTFTQTVSADSEVLSEINNDEETPFKVPLEITATGVAENNVYARESGYSNAIENSAIIGKTSDFVNLYCPSILTDWGIFLTQLMTCQKIAFLSKT